MTLQIIIRPAADEDLDEASVWYEQQRQGLGREFLQSVGETLERICHHPDFGIVVHRHLRRANVRRFPYGVFYVVEHERIVVLGVMHGRRSPRHWKSRLK